MYIFNKKVSAGQWKILVRSATCGGRNSSWHFRWRRYCFLAEKVETRAASNGVSFISCAAVMARKVVSNSCPGPGAGLQRARTCQFVNVTNWKRLLQLRGSSSFARLISPARNSGTKLSRDVLVYICKCWTSRLPVIIILLNTYLTKRTNFLH